MRRSPLVALVVVCLSVAACSVPGASGAGTGSASCAGPYVETEPRQAQPGVALTVVGEGYLDACYDTGEPRQAAVLEDLAVTFRQGEQLTEMGRLDASGADGAVRATITVPAGAQPGLAEVAVGQGQPALVLVGDGAGGFPPWPGPPTGPFPLVIELQEMPSYPEGGWVLATATTVDFQVADADKRVSVVAPLGSPQISFPALFPTYWMVDVRVQRCASQGCPAPVAPDGDPPCEMEVRIEDGPAQMTYTHLLGNAGGCVLQGRG